MAVEKKASASLVQVGMASADQARVLPHLGANLLLSSTLVEARKAARLFQAATLLVGLLRGYP